MRTIRADGVAFSAMVGIGETYLPAFALYVTGSALGAGLAATLPMLVGAVLQLAAPSALHWVNSYRRFIVACALLQAGSFLPLAVSAVTGQVSLLGILLTAMIYWAAGLSAGPAWNAWVGTVVPARIRTSYFAHRTRLAQAGVLVGLAAGGLLLEEFAAEDQLGLGFALLFVIAGVCRGISAGCVARQSEPVQPRHGAVSPQDLRATSASPRLRPTLLGILLMQTSVYIAGPYFIPYMLQELRLPYATFMLLTAIAFVAKIIALPLWGRFSQRFGSPALLGWTGLCIVPLAGLWTLSPSVAYLCAVQVLGGVAWAGFELATFLLFFEAVSTQRRVRLLTHFNLGNAAAIAIGSAIGAGILLTVGGGLRAYLFLFVVSSLGRAGAWFLLIRERGNAVPIAPIATRIIAVRPATGSIDRPILAAMRDSEMRE